MVTPVVADSYYSKVLDRLKIAAEGRGLRFLPEAPSELSWILDVIGVRPKNRTYFGIDGPTSCLVGLILVPKPDRVWSDRAWNRIDEPFRSKLENLERDGWEGKRVTFLLVQVWETDKCVVLVPLKDLFRVATFSNKGDFTVARDGAMFYLRTSWGEENIHLMTSISDLFGFL